MLLSLGLDWLGPLQGLNNLKIPPPSYLWCCQSCTRSRQSLPVRATSRQIRSRVRGCSALSLKPKQDYLISLTKGKENWRAECTQKSGPPKTVGSKPWNLKNVTLFGKGSSKIWLSEESWAEEIILYDQFGPYVPSHLFFFFFFFFKDQLLFKIFIYIFLSVLGLCCCFQTFSSCGE